ncbi:beta-aspartyl-peptidase [Fonticella tunisiensis]|uniref:Isoaspartyl dipeptidase n=1 Tax=Fonticella tunisiensis TaxID=1096341 RepID=A0A4R7KQM7_9CLOT|nr:beta-aspartyl-peptidase [Fonticella tunisiensis]TDT58464.1 beta-aspartyl-dipeptidase (metallo-type) [Fonticella tunisiensis]
MLLIKSPSIYSPDYMGKKSILISSDKIIYISGEIAVPDKNFPEVEVIDGEGLTAIPGIIDLHVHIIGGGGEGGYTTRTPELNLTAFTLNGITTCVGLLGTDGTTRNMANLIAKARSLEIEGITTYTWTGCYQVPTRTLTDSPRTDIVLIDKVIGIGEIAISDHRGSHPSERDLIHLASEARVGGMLSGKCGILHMHVGDGKAGLNPLFDLTRNTEIPHENLLPTHINRNSMLFKQSIEYAREGGFIDITTGIKPEGDDAIHPVEAYKTMLNEGISPYNITMSSDAGGSMPIFDEKGKLIKMGIGLPKTNIEILQGCVETGIPLEIALIPFTSSPAKLLKFHSKGKVAEGFDADIVLLDKNIKPHTVISKGRVMVKNYKPVVLGTFESYES